MSPHSLSLALYNLFGALYSFIGLGKSHEGALVAYARQGRHRGSRSSNHRRPAVRVAHPFLVSRRGLQEFI